MTKEEIEAVGVAIGTAIAKAAPESGASKIDEVLKWLTPITLLVALVAYFFGVEGDGNLRGADLERTNNRVSALEKAVAEGIKTATAIQVIDQKLVGLKDLVRTGIKSRYTAKEAAADEKADAQEHRRLDEAIESVERRLDVLETRRK